MPNEKQNPSSNGDKDEQQAPVETEESGAGYGNNAGDQGKDRD